MPRITNPMGATGNQVAANIKRLRGSVQYKELSEQLAAIGRPMTPVAIRDAENGKRRVDVDDLMAFAIVFGVSPLTLLMPEYGSKDITTRITGYPDEMGSNIAWLWGRADEPLEVPQDPLLPDHSMNDREIAIFRLHARPEIEPRDTVTAVAAWVPSDKDEASKQDRDMLVEANRRAHGQLVRPHNGSYSLAALAGE